MFFHLALAGKTEAINQIIDCILPTQQVGLSDELIKVLIDNNDEIKKYLEDDEETLLKTMANYCSILPEFSLESYAIPITALLV